MSRSYPAAKCCPVTGCFRTVNPGRLMCADHWALLSDEHKSAVWSTWQTVQNWRGRGDRATRQKHLSAYQEACEAAIGTFDRRWKDIFGQPVNPRMVQLPFGGVAK